MPSPNRNEKVTSENRGTQTTQKFLVTRMDVQLQHSIAFNVPNFQQRPRQSFINN